jgi:molybdopterin molybdotransferase
VRTGIAVAEAQRLVLHAVGLLPAETVAAPDALGRVLAEAVRSDRTLPPADCSAMDGFALRCADAPAAPARLRVAYEVPAGGAALRPLAAGEAARIFTGAPLPPGADTVVRQEDAQLEGATVVLRIAPRPRDHVRPAGEDVGAGDVVLEPGARIGPAELGMLAALGRTLVRVHQRPRVAIVSGGDELVEPDADPSGGRIASSNAYALAAQCREAGAVPLNLGIARDTPEDLERLLRAGLAADVLVSSAGVSVGDHDHVRPVLEKLGCRLVFWGVRMKPGYPVVFARREPDGPLVFGLPGNPVSALVTFEQFVRPALRRMAGHAALFRPLVRAVATEDFRKSGDRLHFVRVRLAREGERVLAASTGSQSSGVLRSMTLADGLLLLPAETRAIAAGESAWVQVLAPDFFAASGPGT